MKAAETPIRSSLFSCPVTVNPLDSFSPQTPLPPAATAKASSLAGQQRSRDVPVLVQGIFPPLPHLHLLPPPHITLCAKLCDRVAYTEITAPSLPNCSTTSVQGAANRKPELQEPQHTPVSPVSRIRYEKSHTHWSTRSKHKGAFRRTSIPRERDKEIKYAEQPTSGDGCDAHV